RLPLHEPGMAALLAANRQRITFTADPLQPYRGAGIVFIAVSTPPLPTGGVDLSFLDAALAACPSDWGRTLVMKSTVPVGTGGAIAARLAAAGSPATQYVSNPEFLREGHALIDFLQPDRIVVGAADERAAAQVSSLYEAFDAPIIRTDLATAE